MAEKKAEGKPEKPKTPEKPKKTETKKKTGAGGGASERGSERGSDKGSDKAPDEECETYRGPGDLPLADWVKKVEKMGARGILKEFEALKKEPKPEDRSQVVFTSQRLKNRYEDVGCWDQTRVKLEGKPEGEDYIHASWVDGLGAPKKYILTQGPLEEVADETTGQKDFDDTINAFWSMVWEQKVQVVVMLCLLEEQGKSKCSEYWPATPKERFILGDVAVTNKRSEEKKMDDQLIVVSQLSLQKKGVKKTRELAHYLHKTWPDRKCPAKCGPLFEFMEKLGAVSAHLGKKNGEGAEVPMVVHCSAGIGRSGTLVALEVAKGLMAKEGALDVAQIVRRLRRQRNAAVQTHPQYSSIYVAILHLIQATSPDLLPSSFNLNNFASALNTLLARL